MKRAKNKPVKSKNQKPDRPVDPKRKPFIEHVYELRKRVFYVAMAVIVGAGAAYTIQDKLLALLLRPAGDQQFIYTSPGGGFTFLFNLCLFAGLVFGIPVIVWQLLRYLQPLMNQHAMKFIVWGSIASGLLALLGIVFGYVFGLPASMHFLLGQFGDSTAKVEALITIQSYMSFVLLYLAGSALLFQVPLIMSLINRIKPLSFGGMMSFQRWFIVIAFITGAVISPSPDIQNQAMLSVPMIAMYQLGILIVWFSNRKLRKAEKLKALRDKDEAAQAARRNQFAQAQEAWLHTVRTATNTAPMRTTAAARTWREATAPPVKSHTTTTAAPSRPAYTPTHIPRRSFQIPIQAE